MRALADRDRIENLMKALGDAARTDVRIYFVGGATAVLMGWRASTIDVDLVISPESDELMRAIPRLKEELQVNIEFASPADFIPVPEGWEDRARFISQERRASFFHYDIYAQALAKVERGHHQDLEDVREMVRRGLVQPARAVEYFARMEPELYRFPAVDPPTFKEAVEQAFVRS
jgi:hypothetical protein